MDNPDYLADALAEELALPTTPAEELERHADLHQQHMATYSRRITQARKASRMRIAELEADRKQLQAEHERDMQRIDAMVVEVKRQTAEEIAAAEKLAAIARAAMEMLAS